MRGAGTFRSERKAGAFGANTASLVVGIGFIFIGSLFILVFITGQRIAALIFGGLCVLTGVGILVFLIMNLFRKKPKGDETAAND
jgi:hypothetical protein